MSLASRLLLALAAALLTTASLPAQITASTAGKPSFIDRIRPSDFLDTELRFGEALSKTHDIVVLQLNAGKPLSALMLKHQASGDYAVTLRAPSSSPGGDWLSVSTTLDAPVGRQVEHAIAFTLNRNIMLSPNHRAPNDENTAMWIYQRLVGTPTAAAAISWMSLQDNPEATRFTDGLIGRLQRLVGAEGAAREQLLQEIDRIATQINLTQSGQ